jgi:methylenetetrahydrofolate dehydrogenase (NADP+)/methenyltetrahydrofolate cyclohydrolase
MAAIVIDGLGIAGAVRCEWKRRADGLKRIGVVPGLAVVQIGNHLASKIYVRNKVKACRELGLHSEVHELPEDIGEDGVLAQLRRLNADPDIHGILVQLPLPPRLDREKILATISVDKDIDGFHAQNLGALVIGKAVFPPCTPYGVLQILGHLRIPIEGRNAVIVGRSNIVGKPMALMLLARGATVSVCTSRTRELATYTRLADILVVAAGRPGLVTADMVKEGAAVIDVGINRAPDGRLVGDVDFGAVQERAGYITPVPGGVGPMTIAMLIANTVRAAERQVGARWAAGQRATPSPIPKPAHAVIPVPP